MTAKIVRLAGCRGEPVLQGTAKERNLIRMAECLQRIAEKQGVPCSFERALMIARTPVRT